jgi:hypothetical protein
MPTPNNKIFASSRSLGEKENVEHDQKRAIVVIRSSSIFPSLTPLLNMHLSFSFSPISC